MAENYRRALTKEEIPPAFRNVYGDRTKKPVSVQMAGLGTEVLTPIGTINDISKELEKENPSYVKIAGLAGLELLGTAAPIIEMAAKSGNKGLIQKTIDALKKNESENPQLDPNSAEAIEKQLEEKILFDDIELTDAEKAEIKMEKVGPSDFELKKMADEFEFSYDEDIQKAYDKKIINKEEYLDNKYVLYSKKQAEFIKNPPSYLTDVEAAIEKEYVDNYLNLFNFFDKKELLGVISEFPDAKDFLQEDYTRNILKPMADKANMPINDFYETIENLSRELGTKGRGLTTKPLARARYSGEKVPQKPFLPTDHRGEIEEFRLPKEQRAALLRGNNLGFKDVVYHSSENVEGGFAKEFNQFLTPDQKWLADGNNNFDNLAVGTLHDFLGTHVGTARAAAERSSRAVRNRGGFTMELKARLDKPATFDVLVKESGIDFRDIEPGTIVGEKELGKVLNQVIDNQYPAKLGIQKKEDKLNAVRTFRRRLAEKGYTHVPYINDVEDPTSISYIMLTDRPADSAAVLRDMRAEFDPDKITSPDLRMAEGGPLMNKQMEMAFMKQGGIKDDGMTKDPVSGNEIPPGSMANEVRDNIPAMLSDGEYVVPADVLRYYGVNFFENLRGQAKQGLQTMEQNGRIGGTPMTQQDVARNMQQPVMANTGAMLEPEKQEAPQAMGNQTPGFDQPVQSFSNGGPPDFKSNFNVATARMNTPMFQGTSSQQANIAAAQQNNPNQGAEVTVFKTHYNTNGETTQIKYVQMPGGTLQPAPGQDSELAKYPMTEAEWLAYKKGQGGGGGGGGGGSTTPKGSSTSWMKGIDFTDEASVKAWADNALEFEGEGVASLGGLLVGGPVQIKQANDIAKVRGLADMYAELNPDLAKYLNDAADNAVKSAKGSPIIQALEMAGLMSGENYGKNEELKKRVQFGYETQQETQTIQSGPQGTSDSEGPGVTVTKGGGTTPKGGGAVGDKYTFSDEGLTAEQIAEEEKITDDIFDEIDKELEAAGISTGAGTPSTLPPGSGAPNPTTASNEGGLMTTPKPKKKRGRPKKSGLAGKK